MSTATPAVASLSHTEESAELNSILYEQNRSTSQSKASDVRAAQVQSAVVSKHTSRNSAVWEFFKKCTADRTVAICNLCQMRLKRGKETRCLGTTCLRRHMTTCHASRWHKTMRRSSSPVSTPTICPAMSLTPTSTDRDDATVMDVPGPSSQCDSIPSAEDLRSQITDEEEEEKEAQQTRGTTSSMTNRSTSQSKASDVRAAQVQSAVVSKHTSMNSAVWEFFKKCAADRTVAICNLCQMRIKRGKDTGRLGTTCLRSFSPVSTPTICPAMSLTPTSTDRDDATVMDVPGPSSQCDNIPSAEDLRSQIMLPQLLPRKKKYSPNHPQAQRLNASLAKLLALSGISSAFPKPPPLHSSTIPQRGYGVKALAATKGTIFGCLPLTPILTDLYHFNIGPQGPTLHSSTIPQRGYLRCEGTFCHQRHNIWEGEEEVEAQQTRGTTSSMTNHSTSQSKASDVRAAPVQSAVVSKHTCRNSAVWEFFKKCAADPTVAICNLCQKRLKCGKDTGRLGTTCLRRHMTSCHTSRWLMDVPAPSQCDSIPSAEDLRSQITLPQLLQRKKKYSPNHPQAQHLNASLAKLLTLQLLPFQLVDSASFREFAECAVPQWQVSKCHYFSRKAIPALYQHMEDNVIESLGKAISSKVHVTLDTWSSKHGQGRYISFTAHWVTDCNAILYLSFVCLRDRSHTGPEILSALQGQVQRWLTPRQLQLGMIVCDNGSNLLSALRKGRLTHVPCLVHVLNLVVQRFLTKYPGLAELLSQARNVCSHFRWSFPASIRLAEIQREFHLPTNKQSDLDMPTRWNSILAMLQRLHKQQRAINEYLCEYGTRTGSGQLVFFSPPQWLMIKDACTVLSPFEEATRMVSRDSACISDTIPLVFLLEHTLQEIIDVALEEDSEANATSNLRCMGSLIMQSLLKDPRIQLILPAQREHRMKKLEDALKRHLCNTFPGTGRFPSADTGASEAADDQRNSGEGQGRLTDAFLNFFSPRRPGMSNVGTHCQRLLHMVQDYLGARADLDTFPADDPLAYWVLRLDHWPELSQYAMQLLGCPSSSVLSERTFSAAGGFVTDKRVRLSTDSVDRLTFIKMNQSWISSYQSPDADVTE
uniref:BED-type domain-containing protein n=1 Tax=Leptobrachium leishanense TaxID=445787 RepID=A0A8C5MU29_9ANUR